jgi:hypothetical protein
MDAANSKRTAKGGGWEEDEAFHFIAYVPVNGVLWELDGLRRQPVRLGCNLLIQLIVGECKDGKWLPLATPRIQKRIERYSCIVRSYNRYSAEEIRFNLLAIARRPLPVLKSQLYNLTLLRTEIESRLDNLPPDDAVVTDSVPASELHVDRALIAKAVISGDARDLISMKKAVERDIVSAKGKIADEEEKISKYMVFLVGLLM